MVIGDWWTMGSEGERVPGDAQGPRSSNKVCLQYTCLLSWSGQYERGLILFLCRHRSQCKKGVLAAGHNRGKGRKWAALSKAGWRNRVTTGGLHPAGWRVPGQASREKQQQKNISWHLEQIWFSQLDLNVITYELVWHLEPSHCILLLDINNLLPQARSPWDNDKMKQSKATSSVCPSTDKKHGCWATHRTLKHRSGFFSNSIQSRVNSASLDSLPNHPIQAQIL